jgi:hypothetical protein
MLLAVSLYFNNQMLLPSDALGITGQVRSSEYPYGPYLPSIPKNPFSQDGDSTVLIVQATQNMPTQADGTTAWICKPATKEIRLNQPGTDSEGVSYYNY